MSNIPILHLTDTEEQAQLRASVQKLGEKYGLEYMIEKADSHTYPTELWQEAGELGFIGVNLPEEYGGGGAGLSELIIVQEELAAAGSPLLMLVVSPAIVGTIISSFGTPEQKQKFLPGIASGTLISAFGITEADAGTNSHNIASTAKKVGDSWVINGTKTYISGVDQADYVLYIASIVDDDGNRGLPGMFMVPTDSEGFTAKKIPMEVRMAEWQFQLFLDDVEIPADHLIGSVETGIWGLFTGLNPERIMAAATATGQGRFSLQRAVDYANERNVWGVPIGAHQGLAHPLAQCYIELEMARVMNQKAAALFDQGHSKEAADAANMAKYAAGEACAKTLDQAVQTLGGNGLSTEYGLARMYAASRLLRIAPVSREMLLNYVGTNIMGLPKSY
ncbi:acyl-CoA/acyl-ACP dehydrogenase [Corynebacterium sp. TAE3-ERU12]|uniref:acyl-CoA dehydrogenase family protein n=1 Tax=Corynebacterium sp. TAE3-ERU12 TaxID=2849491 RepID=UPI001C453072|nr:acyl-CoA dehydrogenase family protein [Corynebacterium sp. TAE3-ERU12]MBV7294787.1 acyl-CoA/acyl-ACP dehydrogenase [Corynebacterium sp. TAE3-ERU12]